MYRFVEMIRCDWMPTPLYKLWLYSIEWIISTHTHTHAHSSTIESRIKERRVHKTHTHKVMSVLGIKRKTYTLLPLLGWVFQWWLQALLFRGPIVGIFISIASFCRVRPSLSLSLRTDRINVKRMNTEELHKKKCNNILFYTIYFNTHRGVIRTS